MSNNFRFRVDSCLALRLQVRAVIPRRTDLPGDRGVLIVSFASHRRKAYAFFLVQSEYGDIYKVTLATEGDKVRDAPGDFASPFSLPAAALSSGH